jgi:AcrR family transcriptional regulator
MDSIFPGGKQRQRAPSKRSLETRARILDAAGEARTQVGLVHHHGGGKEELFRQTVARRAEELSGLRLMALEQRKAAGPLDLTSVLECFLGPYLGKAANGGAQWLAYARVVAHVSADPRWREISARYFDPMAGKFVDEIASLYPQASRRAIATGFVYTVSAMLALLTSRWRADALGKAALGSAEEGETDEIGEDDLGELVTFCAAGIAASLKTGNRA